MMFFLSLKVVLFLANSADPDKMQHYAAFYLGLHCLPEYLLRVFSIQRVKKGNNLKTHSNCKISVAILALRKKMGLHILKWICKQ